VGWLARSRSIGSTSARFFPGAALHGFRSEQRHRDLNALPLSRSSGGVAFFAEVVLHGDGGSGLCVAGRACGAPEN
jgi:hypothetical protein